MANPTYLNKDKEYHNVSAPDLYSLLALSTNYGTDMASEGLMLSRSLFGKDAPRDHFTATSSSPTISSLTDAHSFKQKSDSTIKSSLGPMYLARERTDSEKAVNGSDIETLIDRRVMFQEATVKELAGHIPNDNSDELYRRGIEAEAIINGTDRAFGGHFGSHFDKEVSNDLELWPLAASNREEAEAMVEGLERAYGSGPCHRFTYSTDTVGRSDTYHSLGARRRKCRMCPFQWRFIERGSSRHRQIRGVCVLVIDAVPFKRQILV